MRRRNEKVLNEIVFARLSAGNALAAAVLAAVGVERQPLDVTVVTEGDRLHFLGNQFLVVDPTGALDDFGPALVAVLVAELDQILLDDVVDIAITAEQRLVADDLGAEAVVLLEDLVA